jgi:hypothetical protein
MYPIEAGVRGLYPAATGETNVSTISTTKPADEACLAPCTPASRGHGSLLQHGMDLREVPDTLYRHTHLLNAHQTVEELRVAASSAASGATE